MERKNTVGLLFVLASILLGLGACELFQPPPPPPRTIFDAPGKVTLPPGVTDDPTTLLIETGVGSYSPGQDGSFNSQTRSEGPSLGVVRNAAGKTLLLGYLDGAAGAQNQITTLSTAIAILHVALGGFMLPEEGQINLLNLIQQHPATDDLRDVIGERLAANPTALEDGDEQLENAIRAAHLAILGPPPMTMRPKAAPAASRAIPKQNGEGDFVALFTLDPAGGTQQSGVQILQNPDGAGIIAQNHRRRRAQFFVYKSATEDDEGTKTFINPPEQIGDAQDISATQNLSLFTLVRSPWSPVTSPPVVLTVDEEPAKTYFDIVVIGPSSPENAESGPFSLTRYSSSHELWRNARERMMVETVFLDLALPMLKVLFGAGVGVAANAPAAAATQYADLLASDIPTALTAIGRGDLAGAARAIAEAIGESDIVSKNHYQFLTTAGSLIGAAQVDANAAAARATSIARAVWFLTALETALTAGDIGAVLSDIASSNGAEQWEAIGIKPTVHLDPTDPRVQAGELVGITANITAGFDDLHLIFRWRTSGDHGHLVQGETEGDEIESEEKSVRYNADPGASDGDTDTVMVEVLARNEDGSEHSLGDAEVTVHIQEDPVCDELDTAPYGSGCGNFTFSPMQVTAGEILTVNVNVGCNGGTLACDYAYPDEIEVDGVMTPSEFGYPSLYPYDPPRPAPRYNGAAVRLAPGSHTVKFRILLSAPNDCLNVLDDGSNQAIGPWIILGDGSPNTWSSVHHFRVRQQGV